MKRTWISGRIAVASMIALLLPLAAYAQVPDGPPIPSPVEQLELRRDFTLTIPVEVNDLLHGVNEISIGCFLYAEPAEYIQRMIDEYLERQGEHLDYQLLQIYDPLNPQLKIETVPIDPETGSFSGDVTVYMNADGWLPSRARSYRCDLRVLSGRQLLQVRQPSGNLAEVPREGTPFTHTVVGSIR